MIIIFSNPEDNLWFFSFFLPFCKQVSSDKGFVQGFDLRMDKPLFTLKAHEDAVTCMSMSHYLEGALATVSADHTCKLWRIQVNCPPYLFIHDGRFCQGNLNTIVTTVCSIQLCFWKMLSCSNWLQFPCKCYITSFHLTANRQK